MSPWRQPPRPTPEQAIATLLRVGFAAQETPENACPVTEAFWPVVAAGAQAEGLAGLVLFCAARAGWVVPAAVREPLRIAATQVAARNLHIETEVARIAAAFHAAGIELMALKGVALARAAYGRCDLRPMADADLMVREADADRACRLLEELGCERGPALLRPDYFPRLYHEIEYFARTTSWPVRLDVHVRPLRPPFYRNRFSGNMLWHGAERLELAQGFVFVPAPERMLLHLCAHAALHGGRRMLWLLDISRYVAVRGASIDWGVFCELVRQTRLTRAVRTVVSRVERVFGEILPAEVRAELAKTPAGWRERWVLRQAPRDVDHPVAQVITDLVTGDDWADRLARVAALARPQRAHLAGLYPFRHFGWPAAAQAWRVVRAATRPLLRLRRV